MMEMPLDFDSIISRMASTVDDRAPVGPGEAYAADSNLFDRLPELSRADPASVRKLAGMVGCALRCAELLQSGTVNLT